MNNDTLEACNYCGSDVISSGEVMGRKANGVKFYQTGCLTCGALGPEKKTVELADKAWNTRQSIPKERLLKLLTREDIKAANRKGFDPLVYEGMRKIIQELREAIGSMEGKV